MLPESRPLTQPGGSTFNLSAPRNLEHVAPQPAQLSQNSLRESDVHRPNCSVLAKNGGPTGTLNLHQFARFSHCTVTVRSVREAFAEAIFDDPHVTKLLDREARLLRCALGDASGGFRGSVEMWSAFWVFIELGIDRMAAVE